MKKIAALALLAGVGTGAFAQEAPEFVNWYNQDLKGLGMKNTPPSPMTMPVDGSADSVNEIPNFSVVAGGGRAKEQTLGIRR